MKQLLTIKPKLFDLLLMVIGFTLGINFFLWLKFADLQTQSKIALLSYYGLSFWYASMFGVILGLQAFLTFNIRKIFNLSGARLMLARLIAFLLLAIGTLLVSHYSYNYLLSKEYLTLFNRFMKSDMIILLVLFIAVLGGVFQVIITIGSRVGHVTIFNTIAGKYVRPTEEDRVFLFLDLNHSTTIAEELGHIEYSKMIRDCFSVLCELLPMYQGEIYQFVGDEAVITWNVHSLKDPGKPIALFFEFEKCLKKAASRFEAKYGLVPSFKASVNAGLVSVSEIGIERRELAYHGDVLNTGSRVLERCSKLNRKLMITEAFLRLLQTDHGKGITFLESLNARGKVQPIDVFEVNHEWCQ